MKITQNTAVTVRMKVTDSQGNVYDDGKKPVSYLHGDYDNLFPKLEAALEGQEAGFETVVQLASEDALASVTKRWPRPCPRQTSRPASR